MFFKPIEKENMRWILILMLLVGCSATVEEVVEKVEDREQSIGDYGILWGESVEYVNWRYPDMKLVNENYSDPDFKGVKTVLYEKEYGFLGGTIITNRSFVFLDDQLVKVTEKHNSFQSNAEPAKQRFAERFGPPIESRKREGKKGYEVTWYRYRAIPGTFIFCLQFQTRQF